MKIPMMQSITAMTTVPEFKEEFSRACAERVAKGKSNRAHSLKLLKDGERNINTLANTVGLHRTTMLVILKEFSAKGLIEFVTGAGFRAEILGVNTL